MSMATAMAMEDAEVSRLANNEAPGDEKQRKSTGDGPAYK